MTYVLAVNMPALYGLAYLIQISLLVATIEIDQTLKGRLAPITLDAEYYWSAEC